jgi:hypothetical protein
MRDRDYLLNSITLLNEALGLYCANIFSSFDRSILYYIEQTLKKDKLKEAKNQKALYRLSSESKSIILTGTKNKNMFFKDKEVQSIINNNLNKHDFSILQEVIEKANGLRHNLAHGNSGIEIENTKKEISSCIREFEKYMKSNNFS